MWIFPWVLTGSPFPLLLRRTQPRTVAKRSLARSRRRRLRHWVARTCCWACKAAATIRYSWCRWLTLRRAGPATHKVVGLDTGTVLMGCGSSSRTLQCLRAPGGGWGWAAWGRAVRAEAGQCMYVVLMSWADFPHRENSKFQSVTEMGLSKLV